MKEKKQLYTDKIRYYRSYIEIESQWIQSNQLAGGVLLYKKNENGKSTFVPYFSNTGARALIGRSSVQEYADSVLEYLEWYLLHLNSREDDPINGAGTIFDFEIEHSGNQVLSETSTGDYDSVDSYAAGFIILLREYYDQTDDSTFFISNREDVCMVIRAMLNTVDSDGLAMIGNDKRVKYLMDNCEVNRALVDAVFLMETVFPEGSSENTAVRLEMTDLFSDIQETLSDNTAAIEELFWNQEELRYEIGINKNGDLIVFEDWNVFYPDATAQLFPIAFGVISPDSERAEILYGEFCDTFNWEDLEHFKSGEASFYWGILAFTGAMMEDMEKVDTYLKIYVDEIQIDHSYPLYVGDAGWCVMACEKMIDTYEDLIGEIDPLGIVF
jgi:hypothetical protein